MTSNEVASPQRVKKSSVMKHESRLILTKYHTIHTAQISKIGMYRIIKLSDIRKKCDTGCPITDRISDIIQFLKILKKKKSKEKMIKLLAQFIFLLFLFTLGR